MCVCETLSAASGKHVVVGLVLVVRLVEVLDLLLGAARPLPAGRRQRVVVLVVRWRLGRFLGRKQKTLLLRCTRAHVQVHVGPHSLWRRVCSSSSWDCSPPRSRSPSSSCPGLYLRSNRCFSLCGPPQQKVQVGRTFQNRHRRLLVLSLRVRVPDGFIRFLCFGCRRLPGFRSSISQERLLHSCRAERGTISFSSSWSALWWTHLSLPVMVSQTRSCWSRCRTSDRRRHRRRCRTLIRLQDKDGRALNLPAFLLRFLYRRAASRDSPLLLLLSEKADLDEKMLLVSFFFSTGTELQTEM